MGALHPLPLTYSSKLANFMGEGEKKSNPKTNPAIFLLLSCMVQFNKLFARCRMNAAAGLVCWQQPCTSHRGTGGLRSPAWLWALCRGDDTQPPAGLEDEPAEVLCPPDRLFTGQAAKVTVSFGFFFSSWECQFVLGMLFL